MNNGKGFTLIEVMIALVVFAAVSVALVRNATLSLRQAGMVQDRTMAWWLAENEMTELRLLEKSADKYPGASVSRDRIELDDAAWEVETSIQETENDHVRRVVVKVYRESREEPDAQLVGFVGRY